MPPAVYTDAAQATQPFKQFSSSTTSKRLLAKLRPLSDPVMVVAQQQSFASEHLMLIALPVALKASSGKVTQTVTLFLHS